MSKLKLYTSNMYIYCVSIIPQKSCKNISHLHHYYALRKVILGHCSDIPLPSSSSFPLPQIPGWKVEPIPTSGIHIN